MKPQKRSIRDFFSPVSRSPQESPRGTPQLQGTRFPCLHPGRQTDIPHTPDATNARASPVGVSSASRDHTSLTINTPPAPARPAPSTVPHAPHTAKTTSPDAQPPPASQASANSGTSKRIVSNGEQVVLNSDSDSDNDSLIDIDWGVPTTAIKQVAPTTRSKRTTGSDEDGLRKPEKKPNSKKRAFDHVFESAQKNREIEQLIVEHKAGLERKDDKATEFVFNEDALGQAIRDDDDPEQAHRLFLAMQRTHATREENVFHFFHDTSDSIAVQSRFPASSLPQQRWASSFRGAKIVSICREWLLISPRCLCTRPGLSIRLRAPGVPAAGAPRRDGLVDDRPK
jgi:hypothetical protein